MQTIAADWYAGTLKRRGLAVGKLERLEELFAGRHFDSEIILLCVRWYLRFKLACGIWWR